MNILLVCASGMSTGLLMKCFREFFDEKCLPYQINAVSMSECPDVCQDYDVILIAPQVAYRLEPIREITGLPCEVIPSFDYAVGNCERMIKIAEKLYAQKK